MVNKSWTEAKSICESRGARLCKETEWEFACEGEDMNPYPYGFAREAGMCNVDRTDLGGTRDKLRDHRATLAAFPECTSAFGVHDLTGNVDEWVEREGMAAPHRSSLRGGWWLPWPEPLPRRHHAPRRELWRQAGRLPLLRRPRQLRSADQPKSFAGRGTDGVSCASRDSMDAASSCLPSSRAVFA